MSRNLREAVALSERLERQASEAAKRPDAREQLEKLIPEIRSACRDIGWRFKEIAELIAERDALAQASSEVAK